MSITHNKNLNHFLNLLINYISARSTPQILSIKVECGFIFLNFLIIGLFNYSATFCVRSEILATQRKSERIWSDVFSFLIPLPEADLADLQAK